MPEQPELGKGASYLFKAIDQINEVLVKRVKSDHRLCKRKTVSLDINESSFQGPFTVMVKVSCHGINSTY